MELKDLGFSDWFQERYKEFQQLGYSLARVVAVNKDNYRIRNEEAEIQAEIPGKIMYGAESNLVFPTVGDWVHVQYFNEDTFAIIHEILPRKSLLKRKKAGKKIEYQLIASNIDIAFIVFCFKCQSRVAFFVNFFNDCIINDFTFFMKFLNLNIFFNNLGFGFK